jgi:hypothetical protein
MNLLVAEGIVETSSVDFSWGCFIFPALLIAALVLIFRSTRKHGWGMALMASLAGLAALAIALFFVRGSISHE